MTEPRPQKIDAHTLQKLSDQTTDLCLIDVREKDEWDSAHIPTALHIPKGVLTQRIQTILPSYNQAVYLYCKSGVRSLQAAQALIELGYREVYSLEGGIIFWSQCGYSLMVKLVQ